MTKEEYDKALDAILERVRPLFIFIQPDPELDKRALELAKQMAKLTRSK